MGGADLVGSDIARCRSDELRLSFIDFKVAPDLDGLAQLRIDALDGILRPYDAANCRCKGEERNHTVPQAN
jgi:hypothetical protein